MIFNWNENMENCKRENGERWRKEIGNASRSEGRVGDVTTFKSVSWNTWNLLSLKK